MSEEKIKILYLDDEENNLVAFKALFRREYDVFTTTSAREAVEYLNQNEVPVILSDQKMPDISGVEFFEMILPDFPRSVRILVTGYADIEAVVNAINKGEIYRYVAKPWDEHDLRICLKNAVEKYQSNTQSASLLPAIWSLIDADPSLKDLLTKPSLASLAVISVFLYDSEKRAKLSQKDLKALLQIFDCNMDQWNRNDIAQFALKYLDSQGKDPAIEEVETDLNIGFGF
jgi:response regulator RpfG family c-di-GMP phosphodiesterase